MRLVLCAALMAGLSACATPYQDMGFAGGVRATRIDETTLLITGKGNAFTSSDAIQQYTLRKAAEATVAAGYDGFRVVESRDQSRRGLVMNEGNLSSFSKPGETVTIQMFKGPKPAGAPSGVFDAREVLKYMGGQ